MDIIMFEFALIFVCGLQFGVILTILIAIYMEKRSEMIPAGKPEDKKTPKTPKSEPILV